MPPLQATSLAFPLQTWLLRGPCKSDPTVCVDYFGCGWFHLTWCFQVSSMAQLVSWLTSFYACVSMMSVWHTCMHACMHVNADAYVSRRVWGQRSALVLAPIFCFIWDRVSCCWGDWYTRPGSLCLSDHRRTPGLQICATVPSNSFLSEGSAE